MKIKEQKEEWHPKRRREKREILRPKKRRKGRFAKCLPRRKEKARLSAAKENERGPLVPDERKERGRRGTSFGCLKRRTRRGHP